MEPNVNKCSCNILHFQKTSYIEAQISAELSLNSKQAYWKHATFKKDSLSICILHLNSLFIQNERGPVFQESSIMQLRIGSVHDNT